MVVSGSGQDVNRRAYLHLVTRLIVHGWPHENLRDLLPDRILASHPELHVEEHVALPVPAAVAAPSSPAQV